MLPCAFSISTLLVLDFLEGIHMRRISNSIIILAAAVLFAGGAIVGESVAGGICMVLGMFLFFGGLIDLAKTDERPENE